MSNSQETPEILVTRKTLDPKRIRIEPLETFTFKGISNTVAPIRYIDDDGNKSIMCFEGASQFCFGVNEIRGISNGELQGYQICYFETSKENYDNKTMSKEEKNTKEIFDIIRTAVIEDVKKTFKVVKKTGMTDDDIPEDFLNDYLGSNKCTPEQNEYINKYLQIPQGIRIFLERPSGVKEFFQYAKKKDKNGKPTKALDKEAPKRGYFKLEYYKKKSKKDDTKKSKKSKKAKDSSESESEEEANFAITSEFYGPGDVLINPIDLVNESRGHITPLFRVDDIYFGMHGKDQPVGASIRVKIPEANYTPLTNKSKHKRMLNRNRNRDSGAVEESDSDSERNEPKKERKVATKSKESIEESSDDSSKKSKTKKTKEPSEEAKGEYVEDEIQEDSSSEEVKPKKKSKKDKSSKKSKKEKSSDEEEMKPKKSSKKKHSKKEESSSE